jgi:hypothetical protein
MPRPAATIAAVLSDPPRTIDVHAHPFDMGEEQPVAVLDRVNDLSAVDRQRIACGNALSLLGMA